MKSLKNILSALAFVLAIGATFAFSAPNASGELGTIKAHMAGQCTTLYDISDECKLQSLANVCTIPGFGLDAVDPNASVCAQAQVFKRP